MAHASPLVLERLKALVPQRDRATTALAYVLAAACVGHAIQLQNGAYTPDAFSWMAWGLAFALAGTMVPEWRPLERVARAAFAPVAALAMAFALSDLVTMSPGIYLHPPPGPSPLLPFYLRMSVVAIAAAAGLVVVTGRGAARWQLPLLICGFVAAGAWIVRTAPDPFIDVFVFQRDSSNALLHGQNPYTITFPNIYGNGVYYGPNMVVGGRLQFGFVYPPLSLFMAMIGHVAFGDYRYAQLACIALAAVLVAKGAGRFGIYAAAAAGLMLLTPRGFFVLEQGWTEPLVLAWLAAIAFAADRAPRAVPYLLGLFFASKQYAVLAFPCTLLLVRPFSWRAYWDLLWRAAVTGAVVTLPLFLWSPKAFMHSVVELQFYQPFRDDALSILVWIKRTYATTPPVWPAFAGGLAGGLLALWRLPRTPAGFAGGVAITYFLFIALNKQAFANYYFLVIGALFVAAGATLLQDERPPA